MVLFFCTCVVIGFRVFPPLPVANDTGYNAERTMNMTDGVSGHLERLGRHSERLKRLRRRLHERAPGEVVIDGRRLLDDLVRWGVPIHELYLDEPTAGAAWAGSWLHAAERAFVVDERVLEQLAPTRHSQGVLAVASEPEPPPWSGREGCAVFLDRIQDPGNVGAIIRAAAGLGAEAVLLSPGCADPYSPLAVRGSAAAVFRVPVETGVGAGTAAERVRRHGGEVWATGADGLAIEPWQPRRPLIVLLGSEGMGLDPALVGLADGVVTVPVGRGVESLNVAVAAGIILQHLRVSRSC